MKSETTPKRNLFNICFICKTFLQNRGGTEAYIYRMAKALSAKGHVIHIITQEGKEESNLDNLSQEIHIHIIKFNEEPFKGYWRIDKIIPLSRLRFSIAVHKKIKEIQRKYQIDIIESPDWSVAGFWSAIYKVLPICVKLHGAPNLDDYYPNSSNKTNLNKWLT